MTQGSDWCHREQRRRFAAEPGRVVTHGDEERGRTVWPDADEIYEVWSDRLRERDEFSAECLRLST